MVKLINVYITQFKLTMVFHIIFSTNSIGHVDGNDNRLLVLNMNKWDLDGHKDKQNKLFSEDFYVRLLFERANDSEPVVGENLSESESSSCTTAEEDDTGCEEDGWESGQ